MAQLDPTSPSDETEKTLNIFKLQVTAAVRGKVKSVNILGLLHSRSLFNWGGNGGHAVRDDTHGGRDETGEGSDHGWVVDDVLGGVVGHVLLDRDLGHVVDLVVDLVADMLDHRLGHLVGGGMGQWYSGSRHIDGVGGHGGSSLHLNRLRGLDKPIADGWGSNEGSVNNRNGLADGINKPVLVEVLGESLQSQRSVAFWCGDQISDSRCEGSGG